MKKSLLLLLSLLAFSSHAAGVPEKHPTDSFQIGVGASSSQKNFLFDLGLGASNPTLGVDTSVSGLNYSKNIFQFGDGLSSQKSWIANVGLGATNPKIVWSSTNGDWEFSNDGTNFTSIGSGSGGAAGVQLLDNGGFESGLALDWSNSGGTFSLVTGGANLLIGKKSATFTASSNGQYIQSGLHTIPNGLNNSCIASILYKGGDTNLTFQVVDGSSNVLNSQVIQVATIATPISLPFLCIPGQSARVKVIASNAAALIAVDQFFLGQNPLIQVSQAKYMGGVTVASGCYLINSTDSSWVDMAAGGGSCNSGNILKGSVTSFANTGNGGVTFNNLPPGEYTAKFMGTCARGNASGNQVVFEITDGTTSSPGFQVSGATGTMSTPCVIESHFSYSTPGNRTFKLRNYLSAPDNGEFVNNGNAGEFFSLYYYPTQDQMAVRPETINWQVQAKFDASGDTNLGTGTVSSFTDIPNSAGVFTLSPNSTSAFVPCDGGNDSTGTTCSAGNPEIGLALQIPAPQLVEVCAAFSVINAVGGGGAQSSEIFSLIETQNTSNTAIQSGQQFVQLGAYNLSLTGTASKVDFGHVCERFKFTAGKHTIRLNYKMANSTGSAAIVNTTSGSANVLLTARPITQSIPAPILVGSVISQSSGVIDHEFAYVRGASPTADCTSNPCTLPVSSPGISSVTNLGGGGYQINFSVGTFSAPPVCTGTSLHSGTSYTYLGILDGTECSTSNCQFRCQDTSGVGQNCRFNVMCSGPH